jgi:hypothetical protein
MVGAHPAEIVEVEGAEQEQPMSDTGGGERRENPAERFGSPIEIAVATNLSPERKIALLREWEQDLRQQMTASREGMAPPDPNPVPELLRAVLVQLRDLGQDTE